MYHRYVLAAVLLGILRCVASAGDEQAFPFVDGIWIGDVENSSVSGAPEVCWARTTFGDATTFKLVVRGNKDWGLTLSNPSWRLPPSHHYNFVAQVDFYPRLDVAAESKSQKILEFADIERVSLLGFIENGHTIELSAKEIDAKYDLEGSAKVIARLRECIKN